MGLRIDFRRYRRPFVQPLRTAHGEWAVREGFILRVEGPAGVGFGEVAPIPEFGSETVAQAESLLRELVDRPNLIVPEDCPCCAFALSAARRGMALSGKTYPVSGLLPAGAAALDALTAKLGGGYHSFKWKVGVEAAESEQAIFLKLLERLPEGVRLRLDANGGWNLVTLQSWIEVLESHAEQVDYLEQPLPVGQEVAMADSMERSGCAIALDESLQGATGQQWLEPRAWAGPLVIKPALMGNVEALARKLLPVAEQVVLSSVFETQVGLANVLSLADALPKLQRACGFDVQNAFADDFSLPRQDAWLSLSGYNAESLWQKLNTPSS